MTTPSPPPQPYPQQPYPQQPYPQQPYPQQPYPQAATRQQPRAALVGTLLAIAIGVGVIATMFAMTWRSGDDHEKVVAELAATLKRCAPAAGSPAACGVAGLHEGLRDGAATSKQPFEGFNVRSSEVQCNDGSCEARLRGVVRFGSQMLPATFDFVDAGDGWAMVSWEPRTLPPLIPD